MNPQPPAPLDALASSFGLVIGAVGGRLQDALAILRSDQKVDVLFTDINLRGEKRAGLELAERAVKLRPSLGVLYTTGLNVLSPRVAGSEFLPKPYTSSQLIHAVGHLAEAMREAS